MPIWNQNDIEGLAAINIASNFVLKDRSKHLEVGCHFVWEKLLAKEIWMKFCQLQSSLFKYFDLVLERTLNSMFLA